MKARTMPKPIEFDEIDLLAQRLVIAAVSGYCADTEDGGFPGDEYGVASAVIARAYHLASLLVVAAQSRRS
jgi:hypothetical protein